MATATALYVDGDDVAQNSGRVLGNLTVGQALFRDLLPGETRKGILRKVAKGLANKTKNKKEELLDVRPEVALDCCAE